MLPKMQSAEITHICLFSEEGVIERMDAQKDAFELDIPALVARHPDFVFFSLYAGERILFTAYLR